MLLTHLLETINSKLTIYFDCCALFDKQHKVGCQHSAFPDSVALGHDNSALSSFNFNLHHLKSITCFFL